MPTLALELVVRLELAHEPPRAAPEDVGPEDVVPGAVVGERQQQHEADAEAARDDGLDEQEVIDVRAHRAEHNEQHAHLVRGRGRGRGWGRGWG